MCTIWLSSGITPEIPCDRYTRRNLRRIADTCGLRIGLETVQGTMEGVREETMDKDLAEVTQAVITITGDDSVSLRRGLTDLIEQYRAPRAVYALWGSDPAGEAIAREVIEEMDGWW